MGFLREPAIPCFSTEFLVQASAFQHLENNQGRSEEGRQCRRREEGKKVGEILGGRERGKSARSVSRDISTSAVAIATECHFVRAFVSPLELIIYY